jgi:two-component system cell cycle sensor histidine kinase/response regulator CckA
VAHDFNNIVTAILGHSEMLLKKLSAGDPLRQNVEPIEKCGHMAAALTKQLLAFSRKKKIEPRLINLNDVIANVETMLRRLMAKEIEFCIETEPSATQIQADPGQIEQVIMNLVVNARDAMPAGGKLFIKTAKIFLDAAKQKKFSTDKNDFVLLTIADTGTGMSDEVKARLFEPFFTTKPLGKGTGLGLATCLGIVKENNAHIEVDSRIGAGTSFRIYFPAA